MSDLYPVGHGDLEGPYGYALLGLKIATLVAIGVAFAWIAAEWGDYRRQDGRWRLARWAITGVGFVGCATFYGWAAFGAPGEFWRLPLAWISR